LKDRDIVLVKKAIKGNSKALELLLQKHYEQLYRNAYLYVQNKEDSLDIVQETAYQAFRSIKSLKKPEYFMTWLTKIVIHCAMNHYRQRKDVIPLTDEILSKQTSRSTEPAYELMDAIKELKESFRTTLILFYYHDYSIKMISEVMELPEGTVKTNLSRGKQALRKCLKEEMIHG